MTSTKVSVQDCKPYTANVVDHTNGDTVWFFNLTASMKWPNGELLAVMMRLVNMIPTAVVLSQTLF